MKRKTFGLGFLAAGLVLALALTGCPTNVTDEENGDPPSIGPIQGITNDNLVPGEELQVQVSRTPLDSNAVVTWSSNPPGAVQFRAGAGEFADTATGLLVTLRAGDARAGVTVTASVAGGNSQSVTLNIRALRSINIQLDGTQNVPFGGSRTLTVNTEPVASPINIEWSMAPTNLGSLSETTGGTVTFTAGDTAGSVTITATGAGAYEHVTDYILMTVEAPTPATSVTISNPIAVIGLNASHTFQLDVEPANHNDTFEWSSNRPNYVSVTDGGVITGMLETDTPVRITVTSQLNPTVSGFVDVTVIEDLFALRGRVPFTWDFGPGSITPLREEVPPNDSGWFDQGDASETNDAFNTQRPNATNRGNGISFNGMVVHGGAHATRGLGWGSTALVPNLILPTPPPVDTDGNPIIAEDLRGRIQLNGNAANNIITISEVPGPVAVDVFWTRGGASADRAVSIGFNNVFEAFNTPAGTGEDTLHIATGFFRGSETVSVGVRGNASMRVLRVVVREMTAAELDPEVEQIILTQSPLHVSLNDDSFSISAVAVPDGADSSVDWTVVYGSSRVNEIGSTATSITFEPIGAGDVIVRADSTTNPGVSREITVTIHAEGKEWDSPISWRFNPAAGAWAGMTGDNLTNDERDHIYWGDGLTLIASDGNRFLATNTAGGIIGNLQLANASPPEFARIDGLRGTFEIEVAFTGTGGNQTDRSVSVRVGTGVATPIGIMSDGTNLRRAFLELNAGTGEPVFLITVGATRIYEIILTPTVDNFTPPNRPLTEIAIAGENVGTDMAIELTTGSTEQLSIVFTPADHTNSRQITWTSSNADAVTVSTTGLVEAITPGESATITATSAVAGVPFATIMVTVPAGAVMVSDINIVGTRWAFDLNATTNTRQLEFEVLPSAAEQTLAWKSSNENAVTVNDAGLLTRVGAGTATITAMATDGSGVYATTIVDVIDPEEYVFFWTAIGSDSYNLLIGSTVTIDGTRWTRPTGGGTAAVVVDDTGIAFRPFILTLGDTEDNVTASTTGTSNNPGIFDFSVPTIIEIDYIGSDAVGNFQLRVNNNTVSGSASVHDTASQFRTGSLPAGSGTLRAQVPNFATAAEGSSAYSAIRNATLTIRRDGSGAAFQVTGIRLIRGTLD